MQCVTRSLKNTFVNAMCYKESKEYLCQCNVLQDVYSIPLSMQCVTRSLKHTFVNEMCYKESKEYLCQGNVLQGV